MECSESLNAGWPSYVLQIMCIPLRTFQTASMWILNQNYCTTLYIVARRIICQTWVPEQKQGRSLQERMRENQQGEQAWASPGESQQARCLEQKLERKTEEQPQAHTLACTALVQAFEHSLAQTSWTQTAPPTLPSTLPPSAASPSRRKPRDPHTIGSIAIPGCSRSELSSNISIKILWMGPVSWRSNVVVIKELVTHGNLGDGLLGVAFWVSMFILLRRCLQRRVIETSLASAEHGGGHTATRFDCSPANWTWEYSLNWQISFPSFWQSFVHVHVQN